MVMPYGYKECTLFITFIILWGMTKHNNELKRKYGIFRALILSRRMIRWANKSPENESQLKNQPNTRAEALRHSIYGGTLATIPRIIILFIKKKKNVSNFRTRTHTEPELIDGIRVPHQMSIYMYNIPNSVRYTRPFHSIRFEQKQPLKFECLRIFFLIFFFSAQDFTRRMPKSITSTRAGIGVLWMCAAVRIRIYAVHALHPIHSNEFRLIIIQPHIRSHTLAHVSRNFIPNQKYRK